MSVTIAGFPKTSPMIRFALFLPTPGSFKRASKSSGTFPPYCSHKIFIHALISRALLFPSPHGLTISSISSTGASASAFTSGNFSYNFSTTIFTLASVHCAAKRTLTRSFHAWSYSRLHPASGYSFFRRSITSLASSFFLMVSLTSLLSYYKIYSLKHIYFKRYSCLFSGITSFSAGTKLVIPDILS